MQLAWKSASTCVDESPQASKPACHKGFRTISTAQKGYNRAHLPVTNLPFRSWDQVSSTITENAVAEGLISSQYAYPTISISIRLVWQAAPSWVACREESKQMQACCTQHQQTPHFRAIAPRPPRWCSAKKNWHINTIRRLVEKYQCCSQERLGNTDPFCCRTARSHDQPKTSIYAQGRKRQIPVNGIFRLIEKYCRNQKSKRAEHPIIAIRDMRTIKSC